MIQEKSNLLLFGKEIAREGFRYRLYFADGDTLNSENPNLYTMTCLRKKTFSDCDLGKVYNVSYRRKFLNSMSEAAEIGVTEDVFQKLMKHRDILKGPQPVSAFIRSYSGNKSYYTFDEIRRITAYKPVRVKEFWCNGLCSVLYFLCFILPFISFLFSAIYFYMDLLPSKFWHARYFFLLPAFYFLSVPLLIYIMTLLYTLSNSLLLHYERFMAISIKKEALRNGGLRQSILLNQKQKSHLILYGILLGSVNLIFWLIILL